MVRFLSGLTAVVAVGLLLAMPQSAAAQGIGGLGFGGGQQGGLMYNQQLGPPPAGVFLHQQYMQLYGLPVNFQQNQQQYNNNQAGGGGYGGYGGGYPGYNGVNYWRQVAAMQAAYYSNTYSNPAAGYYANGSGYVSPPRPAPVAAFGMGNNYSPSFATSSSPSMAGANGFSGFGLSTAYPFATTDPAKPDETKKDESKTKKGDAK